MLGFGWWNIESRTPQSNPPLPLSPRVRSNVGLCWQGIVISTRQNRISLIFFVPYYRSFLPPARPPRATNEPNLKLRLSPAGHPEPRKSELDGRQEVFIDQQTVHRAIRQCPPPTSAEGLGGAQRRPRHATRIHPQLLLGHMMPL